MYQNPLYSLTGIQSNDDIGFEFDSKTKSVSNSNSESEYGDAATRSYGDAATRSYEFDSESDDDAPELPPPDTFQNFVTVDDTKPVLQCASGPLQIPMTSDCTIRWKLDDLLSQGTQAYIFSTQDSSHVVRIAELEGNATDGETVSPTDRFAGSETYTQFRMDSQIRYYLKCDKPSPEVDQKHCANTKLAPDMYDVYICENKGRYFGISVLEKYDGDLFDMLLRRPDLISWDDLTLKLTELLNCLHSRNVIHRDVGWQNVLYRVETAGPKPYQLVLTDFESSRSETTVTPHQDWDRLYSAYSYDDLTNVRNTIEYLQDAMKFVNLFKQYQGREPPKTAGPLQHAWQSLEALEWSKLTKFFKLNREWLLYLNN